MKFLAAFALIAVAASAAIAPSQIAEIQQIVEAIYSPSTHPATAAALEQMLEQLLENYDLPAEIAPVPTPIVASPALVPDFEPSPAVEPTPGAIAIQPIPVTAPVVAPVTAPAAPVNSAPLVQIILNINQADGSVTPVVAPAVAVAGAEAEIPLTHPVDFVDNIVEEIVPTPINVVEVPTFEPIAVGPAIIPSPIVMPTPVNIVDIPTFEPIAIGPAILPNPAVIPTPVINLPGILN